MRQAPRQFARMTPSHLRLASLLFGVLLVADNSATTCGATFITAVKTVNTQSALKQPIASGPTVDFAQMTRDLNVLRDCIKTPLNLHAIRQAFDHAYRHVTASTTTFALTGEMVERETAPTEALKVLSSIAKTLLPLQADLNSSDSALVNRTFSSLQADPTCPVYSLSDAKSLIANLLLSVATTCAVMIRHMDECVTLSFPLLASFFRLFMSQADWDKEFLDSSFMILLENIKTFDALQLFVNLQTEYFSQVTQPECSIKVKIMFFANYLTTLKYYLKQEETDNEGDLKRIISVYEIMKDQVLDVVLALWLSVFTFVYDRLFPREHDTTLLLSVISSCRAALNDRVTEKIVLFFQDHRRLEFVLESETLRNDALELLDACFDSCPDTFNNSVSLLGQKQQQLIARECARFRMSIIRKDALELLDSCTPTGKSSASAAKCGFIMLKLKRLELHALNDADRESIILRLQTLLVDQFNCTIDKPTNEDMWFLATIVHIITHFSFTTSNPAVLKQATIGVVLCIPIFVRKYRAGDIPEDDPALIMLAVDYIDGRLLSNSLKDLVIRKMETELCESISEISKMTLKQALSVISNLVKLQSLLDKLEDASFIPCLNYAAFMHIVDRAFKTWPEKTEEIFGQAVRWLGHFTPNLLDKAVPISDRILLLEADLRGINNPEWLHRVMREQMKNAVCSPEGVRRAVEFLSRLGLSASLFVPILAVRVIESCTHDDGASSLDSLLRLFANLHAQHHISAINLLVVNRALEGVRSKAQAVKQRK